MTATMMIKHIQEDLLTRNNYMFEKFQKILFNIVRTVWLIVILVIGLGVLFGVCGFLYSIIGIDIFGLPPLF